MLNPFRARVQIGYLLFASVVGVTVIAQAQRDVSQQNPERVVVNTGEVRLDAVVRDKAGRVVKDLNAADFEVYEDGVKQETNSFRFVSRTSRESGGVSNSRENKQNKSG